MAAGSERLQHCWVIGPGRVGLALGLALHRAGAARRWTFSGRRPAPPEHPLFRGEAPARYLPGIALPAPAPDAVLVAVPDGAIRALAEALASAGLPAGVPVLHTSGALGVEALEALARTGVPVGSLHPLAAVSDPVAGAERLAGGWFAVEGDPAARSLAEGLVSDLGGRLLSLRPGAKPVYHAAAVFASNYLVTLLAVAERLMGEAGIDDGAARAAVGELAGGAVEGVLRAGPAGGLTGPVSRGDAEVVARHLVHLSPSDRALYSVLARETLALATARGLDPEAAARILHVLERAE